MRFLLIPVALLALVACGGESEYDLGYKAGEEFMELNSHRLHKETLGITICDPRTDSQWLEMRRIVVNNHNASVEWADGYVQARRDGC